MELSRQIAPGTELKSKVVEGTAYLHNRITKVLFPVAVFVLDDPQTLDTTDGVLDTDAQRSKPLIARFV